MGHAVHMGGGGEEMHFFWNSRKEETIWHLKELGIDGRIIFKWILEKYSLQAWVRLICLKKGISGGMLGTCNEPSCSMRNKGIIRVDECTISS